MKKFTLSLVLASLLLSVSAYANHSEDAKDKKALQKAKAEVSQKGLRIDKNNVSSTHMEDDDQKDTTLIEGNLEDNDFKN
jgi:hypothetical protein